MADARTHISAVIDAGSTLWVDVNRDAALNLDTLGQAIFDQLARQVVGLDDVHIDARHRITLIGEADIDFTPGGDDAAETLLRDMSLGHQDHWFDADPILALGLDFGLQEARIA